MRKALLRKVLLLLFPLALLALGLSTTEAKAPPGTCCIREFAKCAVRCDCGVFEFNCTLDFPGCTASCICNICP
jgi:hypothetical protein